MKKCNPLFLITCSLVLVSTNLSSQTSLAPDQNPSFEKSRSRYMQMADSLNQWHSTTFQDTYKAIDYMADRAEAREQRRAFRRELRLERARNGYGYYNDYDYYGGYSNYYNGYNRYYPVYGGYYGGGYRNYARSYYRRGYRNGVDWGALPLAFALGWYLR